MTNHELVLALLCLSGVDFESIATGLSCGAHKICPTRHHISTLTMFGGIGTSSALNYSVINFRQDKCIR